MSSSVNSKNLFLYQLFKLLVYICCIKSILMRILNIVMNIMFCKNFKSPPLTITSPITSYFAFVDRLVFCSCAFKCLFDLYLPLLLSLLLHCQIIFFKYYNIILGAFYM